MTTTPDYGIPELSQSQANADVTHNEAVQLLQVLHKGATDLGINAPPGSPVNGDVYIVGTAPTGAWATRANAIAVYLGGSWRFIPGFDSAGAAIAIGARHEGLTVWVRDENQFYIWSGSAWAALTLTAANVVNTPAGNIAATTVQAAINELDTEKVAKAGDTMTGTLIIQPGINNGVDVDAGASVGGIISGRTDAGSTGGRIIARHARGSVGAPAVVNANDEASRIVGQFYDGAAYQNSGFFVNRVVAATPSATDGEGRWEYYCPVSGSVVNTEIARFQHSTGFGMFGNNTVIDSNRHLRARVYTIATLPTAVVSGEIISCSDLGGGAGTLESTGVSSAWRRRTPGYQTLGDTTETITPLTHAESLNVTSTLTAARTKTLSNTRAYPGARFAIRRTGLGAFNLTVANHDAAVLFVFPLASTGSVSFVYDGTNWVVEHVGPISGTYTPTLSNTTNVAASTAFSCQFVRFASAVTVSGRVTVDPTAAAATLLGISLPFASNFANAEECAGNAASPDVAGLSAAISGDTVNDRASMRWVAVDIANRDMYFTFTYRII